MDFAILSGPKLVYDPSWKGPLNTNRSTTDLWMLFPFILVLLNWIRVVNLVFGKNITNDFTIHAEATLSDEIWIMLGTLMFILILSILIIAFWRIATKPIVYVFTLFCFFLNILIIGYKIYRAISFEEFAVTSGVSASCMIICLLTLSIAFLVNFYYGFVGMARKIIQETIKALLFFPSLTLCSLLLYILTLVTTVFAVVVASYLERLFYNLQSPFDYVCNQIGNAVGCLWLTSFFFSFFRVVISGTYGTWYWTKNKQEVPKFTPMRFIWITLRYHIGPVITGSLITPIGNFIQVLGVSHLFFADPREINNSGFTRFLQSIYNRIGMINDQAYVYTALRGQGFCQSAKTAFNIWRRNHTKFAAIDQLSRAIIFMGYVLIICLSMTFYLVAKVMTCGNQSILFAGFALLSFYMLIDSIILLMDVAMDTVLICALEDFEVNGNSARPYYMSDKLKEMILESRME